MRKQGVFSLLLLHENMLHEFCRMSFLSKKKPNSIFRPSFSIFTENTKKTAALSFRVSKIPGKSFGKVGKVLVET